MSRTRLSSQWITPSSSLEAAAAVAAARTEAWALARCDGFIGSGEHPEIVEVIATRKHRRAAETDQLEEVWDCVTLAGLRMLDLELRPARAIDVLARVNDRRSGELGPQLFEQALGGLIGHEPGDQYDVLLTGDAVEVLAEPQPRIAVLALLRHPPVARGVHRLHMVDPVLGTVPAGDQWAGAMGGQDRHRGASRCRLKGSDEQMAAGVQLGDQRAVQSNHRQPQFHAIQQRPHRLQAAPTGDGHMHPCVDEPVQTVASKAAERRVGTQQGPIQIAHAHQRGHRRVGPLGLDHVIHQRTAAKLVLRITAVINSLA
jgi:hypothetical protein